MGYGHSLKREKLHYYILYMFVLVGKVGNYIFLYVYYEENVFTIAYSIIYIIMNLKCKTQSKVPERRYFKLSCEILFLYLHYKKIYK